MTTVDQNSIRSINVNNLALDLGQLSPLQFGIRDLLGKLQFGLTRINRNTANCSLSNIVLMNFYFPVIARSINGLNEDVSWGRVRNFIADSREIISSLARSQEITLETQPGHR